MRSPRISSPTSPAGPAAFAAFAVMLAVMFAGGCSHSGGRPFDVAGAQREIAADLASRTGLPLPDVRCPPHVTVKAGRTFTCTTSLDGQPLSLKVSLTNGTGNFTSEAQDAVLLVAKATKAIADGIERQAGEKATVDCGTHTVLVKHAGESFTCTATARTDHQPVIVTVKDNAGNLDYRTATAGAPTSTEPSTPSTPSAPSTSTTRSTPINPTTSASPAKGH